VDISKFDVVVVRQPDGSELNIANRAFAEMPLTERVKLVSQGRARFFKNGEMIPAQQALANPNRR